MYRSTSGQDQQPNMRGPAKVFPLILSYILKLLFLLTISYPNITPILIRPPTFNYNSAGGGDKEIGSSDPVTVIVNVYEIVDEKCYIIYVP